jgi:hypothetical protein
MVPVIEMLTTAGFTASMTSAKLAGAPVGGRIF